MTATPVRGVRVPAGLWEAAQARAERDETTVSAVIVASLIAYAFPPPVKLRSRKPAKS